MFKQFASFPRIVTKFLFPLFIWITFSGSSCGSKVSKVDIEYKADLSGSIRAYLVVEDDELEWVNKELKACGLTSKEVHGSATGTGTGKQAEYIAEYRFDSHKQLERSVDCSKLMQERVVFYPIKVQDNLLSKETTFSILLKDTKGVLKESKDLISNSPKPLLPNEILITTPGEIVSASIVGITPSAQDNYTMQREIIGYNTAQFKIQFSRLAAFSDLTHESAKFKALVKQRCDFDLDAAEGSNDEKDSRDEKQKKEVEEKFRQKYLCFLKTDDEVLGANKCSIPKNLSLESDEFPNLLWNCLPESRKERQYPAFAKKYGNNCDTRKQDFHECFAKEQSRVYAGLEDAPEFKLSVTTRVSKLSNLLKR